MNTFVDSYDIDILYGVFDGERMYEAKIRQLPDAIEYADNVETLRNLVVDTINTTYKALNLKIPSEIKCNFNFVEEIKLSLEVC